MAKNPQKAEATDSTDAEVIKTDPPTEALTAGVTEPPTEAAPTNLTTAAALEAGEHPTVVGAGATQGSFGSVSASPSPAGSAITGSSAKEPESVVHSIVSTQVGSVTRDADTAMHHLRGDVSRLHTLLSNATNYTTLSMSEVEKLIARASVLLGVIRSKL